jgi:hypothetical protein
MKTVVLVFITNDAPAAARTMQAVSDVVRNADVVARNGDFFDGYVERVVGKRPVAAIHAPGHPKIVAAYERAGIPTLEMPAALPPVGDDVPVVVTEDEDAWEGAGDAQTPAGEQPAALPPVGDAQKPRKGRK